jgi:ribonuclease-3
MINLPKFKNLMLLDQAFTHRSYLNEAKDKIPSNERLEFLGDSILSFVVSDFLYRMYPDFDEGTLTNLRSLLVNTKNLSKVAEELNFGTKLKLSKGEEESKGRTNPSLLADSLEAYIGAFYIDQGLKEVTSFLIKILLSNIHLLVQKKSYKDPKSLLQEEVQAKKQSSPIYKVLGETGPAHKKSFTVGVFIQNKMLGIGTGKSKQEASEMAAQLSLEAFGKK